MAKNPQFDAVHDWQALRPKWLELTQSGTLQRDIAKALGIPFGTLAVKAAKWRKEALINGNAMAPAPAPQAGGQGGRRTKKGFGPNQGAGRAKASPQLEAASILLAAMPAAASALVAQLTQPDGTPSRDAQATRAALQLLKDLQHTDESKTASPYASMSDAELERRACELWPMMKTARQLLAHGLGTGQAIATEHSVTAITPTMTPQDATLG